MKGNRYRWRKTRAVNDPGRGPAYKPEHILRQKTGRNGPLFGSDRDQEGYGDRQEKRGSSFEGHQRLRKGGHMPTGKGSGQRRRFAPFDGIRKDAFLVGKRTR